MRSLILFASMPLLPGCATGPSLGVVTNVVVGELSVVTAENAQACASFNLSPREARAFLNRAMLVTPIDLHHGWYSSPCSIRGTAAFRGRPGTWEIGMSGTGTVTLQEEFHFLVADPAQQDHEG